MNKICSQENKTSNGRIDIEGPSMEAQFAMYDKIPVNKVTTFRDALNGNWTVTSSPTFNADILFPNSSIGIRCDNYMYANGNPFNPSGTYSNSNVASYIVTYNGNVGGGTATFYGAALSTGANTSSGTITGNWSLSSGSRLNATYADLAERFASDRAYIPGTVVEIGGPAEVRQVETELSEKVFGVISTNAAYLMNSGAGSDATHPPVAVQGRVPVRVIGTVRKGDRLVSAGDGLARAGKRSEITAWNVIGRALENKQSDGIGMIEAIVKLNS